MGGAHTKLDDNNYWLYIHVCSMFWGRKGVAIPAAVVGGAGFVNCDSDSHLWNMLGGTKLLMGIDTVWTCIP